MGLEDERSKELPRRREEAMVEVKLEKEYYKQKSGRTVVKASVEKSWDLIEQGKENNGAANRPYERYLADGHNKLRDQAGGRPLPV